MAALFARASFGLLAICLTAGCGGDDSGGSGQPLPDAGVEDSSASDAGDAGEDSTPPDGDLPDDGATQPDAQPDAGSPCAKSPGECALEDEQAASDQMDSVAGDEVALRQFLTAVPKGGDLHNHLSGAVYAETYLDWAKTEGGYCINKSTLALSTSCSNTSTTSPVPTPADALFLPVVRAWSMLDFVPGAETGHDHFFATFGKFGAISGPAHHAKGLADVMKRADSENVLYIEPMLFSNSNASSWGSNVWTGGTLTTADLPAFHAALLASSGYGAAVQAILTDIQNAESGALNLLGCKGANPQSACRVGARYMVYISRSGGGPSVFAQMVAAFEAAKTEPRLVALNLVGPEDGSTALSSYDRSMAMLGYLHDAYAGKSPLHVTLHAGELTEKYLPSGYAISQIDHIRKAVQVARAERIGHGLDVLGESNPTALLAELKQLGVMIEIGLSSNVQILEVSGPAHPLATYLKSGVPVALATDDQGVSRSSMAGEYLRAVQDQKLDYKTLKSMARTSLEKSFLPGASLWTSMDTLQAVPACAPTPTSYFGDDPAPATCQIHLGGSAKATAQWELERRFREFESKQ
ncbi:MAG: adenosine deaminase [Myxococcales bacterium]|nr:adenosine deaminase [Myxococcales bacterium]